MSCQTEIYIVQSVAADPTSQQTEKASGNPAIGAVAEISVPENPSREDDAKVRYLYKEYSLFHDAIILSKDRKYAWVTQRGMQSANWDGTNLPSTWNVRHKEKGPFASLKKQIFPFLQHQTRS